MLCVLELSSLVVQIYQIYARRAPGEVHGILRSFGTDYVILEDSICYERRHSRGCRLRDLLDVANGHVSVTQSEGQNTGVAWSDTRLLRAGVAQCVCTVGGKPAGAFGHSQNGHINTACS